MLVALSGLSMALMAALAVGVAVAAARGQRFAVGVLFAGAVTFVASQVVHLPLNYGIDWLAHRPGVPQPTGTAAAVTSGVVLGLSAGLCEELARFVVLITWMKKRVRTAREAVVFGAGHGGFEAVILAVFGALTVVNMAVARGVDLHALGVPDAQAALARRQIDAFYAQAWWMPLLAVVERCCALAFHLSASVLVTRAVARRAPLFLLAAILWHATTDAVAVIAVRLLDAVWTEAILVALTPVSVGIVVWALRERPEAPAP